MSKRLRVIELLAKANNKQIANINKEASMARKPMSKEDKARCKNLRNANYYLSKAGYSIIQAKMGDNHGDYPKSIKSLEQGGNEA